MFWNPRFVSPIAIRFSFGRGLRDATRRGTWSRLRWVARDVRAPGRSQSGPMRARLLAWGDRLLVADAVRAAGFCSVDFVVRPGARLRAGFVCAGRHGVGARPAGCGGVEGDCSDECEAWLREHCGSPFVEPRWLGRSKATCVPVLPVETRPGT